VDNLGGRYKNIPRKAAVRALEWLREEYPVDEARAAEEWAEKEANRIAYNLWLADPENADSKYNDPARVWRELQQQQKEEEAEYEQEEGQRIGILRVGPSQFERNIEQKRKERLAEITRQAEEKEQKAKEDEAKLATGEYVRTPGGTALMKPGQEAYVDIFGREQVSRRKEVLAEYQKKSETPFSSEEDMLKHTTLVSMTLPPSHMGLFYLLICNNRHNEYTL
jgi:rhomboid-like protein